MISQIEAIQPGVGYSIFSVAFLVKIVKSFCVRRPKLSTNKKRQAAKPVSQMQMCGETDNQTIRQSAFTTLNSMVTA